MMHASPWWIAGVDGGLERSNSEPRIDRAADSITYDPTGPSIEDRSQVHKASRDCDISDVGHPEQSWLGPSGVMLLSVPQSLLIRADKVIE